MSQDHESGSGAGGKGTIVVIDPNPTSRNLAEDLEDDFERQVIAIDSTEFDPESSEEVLEAEVYIINWDLGIRCGADLLEEVRHTPSLADKIVLVALQAPTAARVRSAMRLGADGVCTLPYDAGEIAARFEAIEARHAAAA